MCLSVTILALLLNFVQQPIQLDQWKQALVTGQKILTYIEKKYGQSDIKTGIHLIKMANLYAHQDKDKYVLESLAKSLVIFEKAYGENHSRTVTVRKILLNYSLKRSIDYLQTGLKDLLAELEIINQSLKVEMDIKTNH